MQSVKYINRAIVRSAHGRSADGTYPTYYGTQSGNPARIMDCRSRRGTLQVKFLSTGVWVDVVGTDYVMADGTRYNPTVPTFASLTIADLRANVPDFFGRANKRFFGDKKYAIANGNAGTFLVVRTAHSVAIYRYVPAVGDNAADLMFAKHADTFDAGRDIARKLSRGISI